MEQDRDQAVTNNAKAGWLFGLGLISGWIIGILGSAYPLAVCALLPMVFLAAWIAGKWFPVGQR